jgi:hypothetical protein
MVLEPMLIEQSSLATSIGAGGQRNAMMEGQAVQNARQLLPAYSYRCYLLAVQTRAKAWVLADRRFPRRREVYRQRAGIRVRRIEP